MSQYDARYYIIDNHSRRISNHAAPSTDTVRRIFPQSLHTEYINCSSADAYTVLPAVSLKRAIVGLHC